MTATLRNPQLKGLLELLTVSLQEIEAAYHAGGHDIPSLDSVESGPYDVPEKMSFQLTKAIQMVEGACAQICASVAPPGHIVLNKAFQFEEPACLQVATSAKVTGFLLDKPDGLHANELAKLANVDAGRLGRILRLLATKHVYKEVKPNVYANNRLSMKLLHTDPVSSCIGHATDECMKASYYLWDTLQDPEYSASHSAEHSPFQKVYGCTVFKYFQENSCGKLQFERFNQAMTGWGVVTGKGLLPKIYPWSELSQDTVICDVGGNNGHIMLDLIKSYPTLKVVVQDRGALQQPFQQLWSEGHPEALEQRRAEFIPIDFFKESPRKDCDFYYSRHVLHDWPDAESIKILQNIKAAMKPTSRVLIHEFVLQEASRSQASEASSTGEDIAPEPLLPNYGAGRIRRYHQDINMMCVLNSKERTLQEFVDLGTQAGLTFAKVWESGETALVEFTL